MPEGAKDLAVEEPAPFGCELDGYAHLPRLLDKARATLAGTAGRFQFGCPVDHTCMARLGVAPELVLELAGRFADDRDVLAALREHGIPPARDAWFDAVAVEDELQEAGTYLRVRETGALAEHPLGRRLAGAEHGADVDVVVVELARGAIVEQPASAAQVWVVQAGEATFFLGERQARVVRAGEVVRVPAGVPFRVEIRGDAGVRAVAAGPAAAP
jgi:quercetin dioxygenase-like cupin family protein